MKNLLQGFDTDWRPLVCVGACARVGALSLVTNQCQHAHTLTSVASHMHVELFQAIVLMGMVIGLNVAFILKNMNNVVKVGFFRC